MVPYSCAKLDAIHSRHGNIADDNVGKRLLRGLKGLSPVKCCENTVAGFLQHYLHNPHLVGDVVDYEHSISGLALGCEHQKFSSAVMRLMRNFTSSNVESRSTEFTKSIAESVKVSSHYFTLP